MALTLKKYDTHEVRQKEDNTLCTLDHQAPFRITVTWANNEIEFKQNPLLPPQHLDLDMTATSFNQANIAVDTVDYRKLHSRDRAITHSGDRMSAPSNIDQYLDIQPWKIDASISQIVIYLSCYMRVDFSQIRFTSLKASSASLDREEIFTQHASPHFQGANTLILGKLVKSSDGWSLKPLGFPSPARNPREAIADIKKFCLQP